MTLDPFDPTVMGIRSIRLYRAVSEAEFEQWQATRVFETVANSLEGKWFALSHEDAVRWGEWFAGKTGIPHVKIIAVKVPEALYDQFDDGPKRLDGIGPAKFAPIELIQGKVFDEVIA